MLILSSLDKPMEQRVNLKCLVKLGKTFTEAYAMLKEVYGKECLSLTQVFEWFIRFKEGRETTEDETSKTDEHIEKIGHNTTEIHRNQMAACGDNAPSLATCKRWFARFRSGDYSINDKPRYGRPLQLAFDRLQAYATLKVNFYVYVPVHLYGNEYLFRTKVFEWFKRFKKGREANEDDPCGQPSTSNTDENIERIGKLIREDRRLRLRLLWMQLLTKS
ncbi:hypothetical protein NQ318_004693 [Aromia moschata]|uniref:Mos1 transposase HTH domain-containing protein n=1 Tax=Aromia moschata TaxID=1265417 RepID=A0AAV8X6D6_9CUCU|nr:hypothetical protein NQ318_004693 [Aromia moschata]